MTTQKNAKTPLSLLALLPLVGLLAFAPSAGARGETIKPPEVECTMPGHIVVCKPIKTPPAPSNPK